MDRIDPARRVFDRMKRADEIELRDPKDIIAEMAALDAETMRILRQIETLL